MKFIKYLSPIYLLFSVLLLIYTFYQSEITWLSSRNNIYLQYYLLSSILIILSIISFFLKNKIKLNSLIFLISITITLYFIEISLIFFENYKKKNIIKIQDTVYYEKTNKKFDRRTKFEVYENINKKNNF